MNNWRCLLIITVLLLFCNGKKNPTGGSLAPEISATVYDAGGITGADNAIVKVFDACDTGSDPVFVTLTDKSGKFTISELDDGIYGFWAEKESLVLFQDSVPVASMHSTLHDDTLERSSSLTATVGLQEYHDARSVTISIIGFDKPEVVPDVRGRFTITGMAGGTWPLLLRSTIPGYLPATVAVTIAAAANDTLTDTIGLYYAGIPVVSGILFTQDTLAGLLRLSWAKPAFKMVRDYLVYRDFCTTSRFSKAPAFITEDTCYVDSIKLPPEINEQDTLQQCLSYRIAIRTTLQEIGATGRRVEVRIAPRAFCATFLTHKVTYSNDSSETTTKGDTVLVSISAKSRTRSVRKIAWYDPAKKDTVKTISASDTASGKLVDTLRYTFDTLGTRRLIAIATDNAGARWTDTIPIVIIADSIAASAGNDTAVLSCDTVRFHGEVRRKSGSGGNFSWKFGSGRWTPTSGSDTAVAASALTSINEIVICSLAVADNKGNKAFDIIHVKVTVIPLPLTTRVVAGGFHNLLLDENGSLTGVGMNDSGQLGTLSVNSWMGLTPVMTNVRSMDAGAFHSLILKNDGSVWTCGLNNHGQLGDSTFRSRSTPVQISDSVKSVAAGSDHSLLLTVSGVLYSCGANGSGQLGDSTTTDRPMPRPVMTDIQSMTAGGAHSLFLKNDGSVWACGENRYGQLGDGTNENRTVPVQVMTGVRTVKAGGHHSLLLKNDGSLWACGWNYAGQLGDGTVDNRTTPVRIMSDVKDMACGDLHTLILRQDGTLWTCGENGMGQLGDGTNVDKFLPVKIMGEVRGIDAGEWHSLILQKNGSVWINGWASYNADTYGGTGIIWQAESGRLIPQEW